MHEVSIIESLINTIGKYCSENKIKRVLKVDIDAGKYLFHGVENLHLEDNLKFIFEKLSKDTICEDAHLNVNITEGNDLVLKRIEGE